MCSHVSDYLILFYRSLLIVLFYSPLTCYSSIYILPELPFQFGVLYDSLSFELHASLAVY